MVMRHWLASYVPLRLDLECMVILESDHHRSTAQATVALAYLRSACSAWRQCSWPQHYTPDWHVGALDLGAARGLQHQPGAFLSPLCEAAWQMSMRLRQGRVSGEN